MRLRYAILYVEDVAASLAFYEEAFGLQREMLHDSGDYGQLGTGETSLAFSSTKLMKSLGKTPRTPDPKRPTSEIAFEVENVNAAFARAREAGAVAIQGPREEPWGQTTSYVADLDGHLIEICSPVASGS